MSRPLRDPPYWQGATIQDPVSIARLRSSTCQWAWPVVLVNAAGTVRMLAPACGEHAVEIGESQVVADRHSDLAPGRGREHRVAARLRRPPTRGSSGLLRGRRRTCGSCCSAPRSSPAVSIRYERLWARPGLASIARDPSRSQTSSSAASARKRASAGCWSSGRMPTSRRRSRMSRQERNSGRQIRSARRRWASRIRRSHCAMLAFMSAPARFCTQATRKDSLMSRFSGGTSDERRA